MCSSDMLRGPVQEFDFGSDAEEDEPAPLLRGRKSKQSGQSPNIVPTGSDDSSESDSDGDDDRITIANMEARSRALDAKAAEEAELDIEEFQAAAGSEDEDEDADMEGQEDANGDMDAEPFRLPTAAEREEEKISVPDVHLVQRRMRECVRILGKFKRLAEKGRWVFRQKSRRCLY